MISGIVYDQNTGKIIRLHQTPTREELEMQKGEGQDVLEGVTISDRSLFDEHYVDVDTNPPTVVARQTINPIVSTQTGEATLSDLPDPVTISWRGQSTTIEGGSATIKFDEPGEYTLHLSAEPTHVARDFAVTIP